MSAQTNDTRVDCGIVTSEAVDEASGIAASRLNPGTLWTHNDSGDIARVFALDTSGAVRAEVHLEGIDTFDCEDIAVGPGPEPGVSYLYLADIGDNLAIRNKIRVYRFPEPDVSALRDEGDEPTIARVTVLTCYYPDGSRDAETLLVDPDTSDLLVVTKREQHVRIYRLIVPRDEKLTMPLTYLTDMALTGVVGGDISPDGRRLVIKTYDTVYSWTLERETPIEVAVLDTPQSLPYIREPQGEAICWDVEGDGYYTISERHGDTPVHLYYYPLTK